MSLTNIQEDFANRVIPNYEQDEVTFVFPNEDVYLKWYNEVARYHSTWICHIKNKRHPQNEQFINQPIAEPLPILSSYYVCDHGGKPKIKSEDKKKSNKESIKIGCPARFIKYTMTDNSVKVNYKWKHIGHNPSDVDEAIRSRLPFEVKEWLKKHVDQDLDWKQIKNLLRVDESRLDEVSIVLFNSFLPKILTMKLFIRLKITLSLIPFLPPFLSSIKMLKI